jgi:hypothetical protein
MSRERDYSTVERAVLTGPITLKPNQKLLGVSPSGQAPRYEAEQPQITSSVVEDAIYDTPYNNGRYRPTTGSVMLAHGVEVSGNTATGSAFAR